MKTPIRRSIPAPLRFWAKVEGGDATECWLWQGAITGGGYGDFYVGRLGGIRVKMAAHRWAYEHLRAEIPIGLQLDHLCRTRACVNPWHLEPVTHAENNRRGERANRTHCPANHEYTPENTYKAARGDRQCRTCIKKRTREAWQAVLARRSNPAQPTEGVAA